jgi:FtsP/CotA-like multicopper oxidase with cupredoxin domain
VLEILEARVELAQGHCISTMTYNGRVPGPLLRAAVGEQVRVDVCNRSETPQWVSWPGQILELQSSARHAQAHSEHFVDGRAIIKADPMGREAGFVPAKSVRRFQFTARRAGLHLYHAGSLADSLITGGSYSAQAGAVLVEGREPPPDRSRREWVLVLNDHEPFLRRTRRGFEVEYSTLTLNGRPPGFWRVRAGERMLIHVLNASATQPYSVELPGHTFEVIALDGTAVATRRATALHLSPGESAAALLEVNRSQSWIVRRTQGRLDYRAFTRVGTDRDRSGSDRGTTETLRVVLRRHEGARSGFSRWSINGAGFSVADPTPMFRLRRGLRYRLAIHNTTDELLPMRLQHHRLELVAAGTPALPGIEKDVVAIAPAEQVELEFAADNPGPALLYCTRQLHRAFGLMTCFDFV